jgi:outer membrane protease
MTPVIMMSVRAAISSIIKFKVLPSSNLLNNHSPSPSNHSLSLNNLSSNSKNQWYLCEASAQKVSHSNTAPIPDNAILTKARQLSGAIYAKAASL